MELTVDASHLGTPESVWRSSGRVAALECLEPLRAARVVVVAPHPDDEVLGAGGLIQESLAEAIPLQVVAVTDGEASHPRSSTVRSIDLRGVRAAEAQLALRRLGWEAPAVTRLGLPDGRVVEHLEPLTQALGEHLRPGDLVVAPWPCDGHPDHDACGLAAARASVQVGARMLGYLVWAWHWAAPDCRDLPWEDSRRLDLTRRRTARKRWATCAFRSQIRPLGFAPQDAAVLPEAILRRFWRSYEVYVNEPCIAEHRHAELSVAEQSARIQAG